MTSKAEQKPNILPSARGLPLPPRMRFSPFEDFRDEFQPGDTRRAEDIFSGHTSPPSPGFPLNWKRAFRRSAIIERSGVRAFARPTLAVILRCDLFFPPSYDAFTMTSPGAGLTSPALPYVTIQCDLVSLPSDFTSEPPALRP